MPLSYRLILQQEAPPSINYVNATAKIIPLLSKQATGYEHTTFEDKFSSAYAPQWETYKFHNLKVWSLEVDKKVSSDGFISKHYI